MSVAASVVHELAERTRIKIPSKRGQESYFERLTQQLTECPGVAEVESNFRTGSVLIRHSVPFAQVASFANEQRLFTVAADNAAPGAVVQQWSQSFTRWDQWLFGVSSGSLDLRSMLFVALVVMSVVQLARGEVLAPAATLLWYALELLSRRELLPAKSQ